jgi:leucyl/phenylalanyl-tRNA--protein transferase
VIFRWRHSKLWRDPELADASGLLAIGGDLCPSRLLEAYRRGIFPWYDDNLPICWWSPDPRAIFELDCFHVSRRLRRKCRSGRFRVTFDRAFAEVIRGCADRPGQGTWITQEMIEAYESLHELGHAHSVEVWANPTNGPRMEHGSNTDFLPCSVRVSSVASSTDFGFEIADFGVLVGGVYGVAVGGLFAGESMFSRRPDASKIALVHLVERLRKRGFQLFDIQFLNDHTARLGAVEIPRREYLTRLRAALECDVSLQSDSDSQPPLGFYSTLHGG